MSPKQQRSTDHTAKAKTALFSCYFETAKTVFLAGSFNGWDPTATPMEREGGGRWTTTVQLAPGRYEFKFVVDDVWCCEPGCAALNVVSPRCVTNAFGTKNCVLKFH